jgi:hypothetical protein
MTTVGDPRKYWLYSDLVEQAKRLASNVVREQQVSAVAGVPRSGMLAASAAAIYLGVPLLEASMDGIRSIGHGRRLDNVRHEGRVLIMEDSLNTGRRFRDLKRQLGSNYIYSSVFSTPRAKQYADYVGVELELPHWFDWWLWGSRHMQMARIGTDFDGILCEDCPRDKDTDDQRYIDWMSSVPVLRHAWPYGVPVIITGRLSKYQNETRQWLDKNHQKAVTLAMGDWPTAAERRGIAEFKADQCKKLNLTAFIESDERQAKIIAERAKIPVPCPAAGWVFGQH